MKSFRIIFLLFAQIYTALFIHQASKNLQKRLNLEETQTICCLNHLPCCQRPDQTNFEVKVLLTQCPNLQCSNYSSGQIVVQNRHKQTEKLTNCNEKLLLTIKIVNEGMTVGKSQYVIIDHVTDPITLKKVRILNPYAVRIRQEPILEVYPLFFERSVNAEPKEVIYNRNTRHYRGCDVESSPNPVCGVFEKSGKLIPYSGGFCCTCNPPVPADHKTHNGFMKTEADKGINYIKGPFRQKRGGQICNGHNIPESLHDSTHCLSFSQLWYGVHHLKKPKILHNLRIQVFQKYEDCHGQTHWMDVTQGKVVEIGSKQPFHADRDIIAKYSSDPVDSNDFSLDYKNLRLLIPERRLTNAGQFLIVPRKMVSKDGTACDSVGVGYEAFYKQKKRCSQSPGSCLRNQPQHLYDEDFEADTSGRNGRYFLKFFGSLAQTPVEYNSTGQIQFLKMIFAKVHTSQLYFEVNADVVTLLKPHAYATITEVYTDATNPSRTHLIVKVTNSGLLYGVFYVRLGNCPLEVPASFNNIASKAVLIPAQHQHIFNLFIEYDLPISSLECSIHVHNINQESMASRKITIRGYDRCICIWHCQCACFLYQQQHLKCLPLSIQEYHAAGFQGGFAHPTHLVQASNFDEILATFFSLFTFFLLTLLAMGLIKALLGLGFTPIGLWGLDTILGIDVSKVVICDNKDCENRDDDVSQAAQFCLNLVFFLLYPLVLCNRALKSLFYPKITNEAVTAGDCGDELCPSSGKTDKSFSLKYSTSEDRSTNPDIEPRSREPRMEALKEEPEFYQE